MLKDYSKKQKIKLAKYENTSIKMIDELLKDNIEIKIEVFRRKDFNKIKDLLKNFDEKEYEFFKICTMKGIENEKIKFILCSIFFIWGFGIFLTLAIYMIELHTYETYINNKNIDININNN